MTQTLATQRTATKKSNDDDGLVKHVLKNSEDYFTISKTGYRRWKRSPVVDRFITILYHEQNMSLSRIADILGTTRQALSKRMMTAGIPRRGYGDAARVDWKRRRRNSRAR